MHALELIDFKNLSETDLKKVLQLRNLESVRVNMVQQDIIDLDEHMAFCLSLKERTDKLCLCFKCDGHICGIINLSDIEHGQCDLGYYFVKKPFAGFTKACFLAMGGGAQKLGIRLFTIFVRQSNKKGLDFAKERLGAYLVKEDADYVYFTLELHEYLKIHEAWALDKINHVYTLTCNINI